MKSIVVYYSRKGSNKYLAEKISMNLQCEIEAIKPRINSFFFFLLNIHFGIKPLKIDLNKYDRIILCGPIWMGRFIPPLKSFVKKYQDKINKLVFVTCCGSTYEKKDEKFGHGIVFNQVNEMLNGKCELCQAFPIDLVLPEELKDDSEAFMNTHLNDENFTGEIVEIFDGFMGKLKN